MSSDSLLSWICFFTTSETTMLSTSTRNFYLHSRNAFKTWTSLFHSKVSTFLIIVSFLYLYGTEFLAYQLTISIKCEVFVFLKILLFCWICFILNVWCIFVEIIYKSLIIRFSCYLLFNVRVQCVLFTLIFNYNRNYIMSSFEICEELLVSSLTADV